MKSSLIYLVSVIVFLSLFALSYTGRVVGPDQQWYQIETELALKSGNPLQIDYNRVYDACIENEKIAYLPIHHSLYHVFVFLYAKVLGSFHGILLSNLVAAFVGMFFISKSTYLITKSHLYSAIVGALVLIYPLTFWYTIQALQEIHFFAWSSIIVFFYLKSLYAIPNSKEEFVSKISMYVLCCIGIFLYPVFLMTLAFLLFFELIFDAKKNKYMVLFFSVIGLFCYYLAGLLFPSLVGELLMTNIFYGERSPSTLGAFFMSLTESFEPISWFLHKTKRFFLAVIEYGYAAVFFLSSFALLFLNLFLLWKKPNIQTFKISILLFSFALAIFAMMFLSQCRVRYLLYMYPALIVSLVYFIKNIAFVQKIKGRYLAMGFVFLFISFILGDLIFIRKFKRTNDLDMALELSYHENFSYKLKAEDRLLLLVKNLESHESDALVSFSPLTTRVYVPYMENSYEDIVRRSNKFSATKILIYEHSSEYVKDICSEFTDKGIIEIGGAKYLYFEKP